MRSLSANVYAFYDFVIGDFEAKPVSRSRGADTQAAKRLAQRALGKSCTAACTTFIQACCVISFALWRSDDFAISDRFSGASLRCHVLHARAREARDQPGAALEAHVVPGPVRRDQETVPKSDQKVDVSDAPKRPSDEASEP